MSALQKELIKENQKINWIPAHIKDGRFGEWLGQVKDWAISRERYWGTPLPIWKCPKCEEIKVIGSYQELHQETQCPLVIKDDFDPHRPFIDEYVLKCKCGGEMGRVKEVADCWFDSGSMPLAQYHYPFENKEKIESAAYYPADFIAEAIDQTRGWFYTMLAVGVLVERGTSYKNVICLGHINDAQGRKMSKRLGNIVNPWEVINKWGADALRLHLFTINQPGESKSFDIKNVESVIKRTFMILYNVLSFYQMYQGGQRPSTDWPKSENILDKWVLARLNQLVEGVTDNLDKYNIFTAGRGLMDFIDELSTWYLRRSRERFKGEDQKDKEQAVQTLGFCLLTLSKLMAPFTPFMAEDLYQKLGGSKESVHLDDWPEAENQKLKNEDLNIIEKMEAVREAVRLGLSARDLASIKVRQPLSLLYIDVRGFDFMYAEFVKLVKEEVNVFDVQPIIDQTGKTIKRDRGIVLVKDGIFKGKYANDKDGNNFVSLKLDLTDELKELGILRELVRTVNQLRKEAKLTIKDQIIIHYQTDSDLVKKVIKQFEKELLKSTIAKKIESAKADKYLIEKESEVNGEKVWLGIAES
jgi:isoleucyl-tRNA synthetase